MDPLLKECVASLHKQKRHAKALHHIIMAWHEIPWHIRVSCTNDFLLERADCYWYLKDSQRCFDILQEVNSNGLPIACNYSGIHKVMANQIKSNYDQDS
jgi:hypothetical protein